MAISIPIITTYNAKTKRNSDTNNANTYTTIDT